MNAHSIEVKLEDERRGVARPPWLSTLGLVAFLAVVAAQIFGFVVSRPDRDMGNLQKIMYVHVPAAWTAFVCFFVVFVESVRYLWTRQERHDLIAASAAEAGAALTALTLLLGSIWGRPTWGVWWTWDARLTSTAVLLLVYVGYLLLRAMVDEPEMRARYAAVVGIVGAANIPIVHFSVKWWRALHQPAAMLGPGRAPMPEWMKMVVLVNWIAFTLLFAYFLSRRLEIARLEEQG